MDGDLKICDIGNVFAYIWRTSGDIAKWMVPFNSAHQIGLTTLLKEVLTLDEGVCGQCFKICKIGNLFAYNWRTNKDTAKWMVPFDSARQIGLDTLLQEVLTVAEVVWMMI